MSGPSYWENIGHPEVWNHPNSFETPKKIAVYEPPREISTPDFPSISPNMEAPTFMITSFPLDDYCSPANQTPQQNWPTDESGYWTSPRSSRNSANSQISSIDAHSQTRAQSDWDASNGAHFTPMRQMRDLTPIRPMTPTKPKSLLEQLIADDSSDERAKTPEERRQFASPPKRIRRVYKRRRRSEPKPVSQKIDGPYKERWLNNVYWFHFYDFMKKNYYDVMEVSFQEAMHQYADQSRQASAMKDRPVNELDSQDQPIQNQSSSDDSTEAESTEDGSKQDEDLLEMIIRDADGQELNFD